MFHRLTSTSTSRTTAIAVPRFAIALLVGALAAGCGAHDGPGDDDPGGDDAPEVDADPNLGDPDAPPASCVDIAGTWGLTGSCGADVCVVTQVGCSLSQVRCESGAVSTSGSVTGPAFTYTGTNGDGLPTTCSGTASGNAASGTCTPVGGGASCEFAADRLAL